MEVDQWEESQWRKLILEAFAASMIVKPFTWVSQGVILLDLKVAKSLIKPVTTPSVPGWLSCNTWLIKSN